MSKPKAEKLWRPGDPVPKHYVIHKTPEGEERIVRKKFIEALEGEKVGHRLGATQSEKCRIKNRESSKKYYASLSPEERAKLSERNSRASKAGNKALSNLMSARSRSRIPDEDVGEIRSLSHNEYKRRRNELMRKYNITRDSIENMYYGATYQRLNAIYPPKPKIGKSATFGNPVSIDGIEYISKREAGRALGVTDVTVEKRIRSAKFPTWIRLNKD